MATPSLQFTVAFDEADGEGIVFFGNYFRLAHRALEQWLPLVEIPWAEWFANSEFGVPLRHVEADYKAPLKPGDTFEAKIYVAELGESSVHFLYEFRLQDQLVAQLKTSHVFISRRERQKIRLPESLRARLQTQLRT